MWLALTAPERVTRVALIGSSTSEGWFARERRLARALIGFALYLPTTVWVPILRGMIARSYSDPERGKRSAEKYLAPFLDGNGVAILRRHLSALTNGEIRQVALRANKVAVPVLSSLPSPWRFMPEENPSEAAALITRALGASGQ